MTEDFELSIDLHSRGWRSVYVPEVLARGLGPEDMASYVSQQQRWARGCLSGVGAALRARLPARLRAQYLLSSLYFLSGWTIAVYMALPVVRMLTGAQPLGGVVGRPVPAPLRPLLRGGAAHRGAGRRGRLHLRRLRARGGELLDPHPGLDARAAAPPGPVRGDAQAGQPSPASRASWRRRSRRWPCSRGRRSCGSRSTSSPACSTTRPSRCSTSRSCSWACGPRCARRAPRRAPAPSLAPAAADA